MTASTRGSDNEQRIKYKWLLDWGWFLSQPVSRKGIKQLLFYSDGSVRFMHDCRMLADDLQLVCAPLLREFQISTRDPIVDKVPVTITPSIDCSDCGLHGFVTDDWWRDA